MGISIGPQRTEVNRHDGSEPIVESVLRALDADPRLSSGAGVRRADREVEFIRMTGSTTSGVPAPAQRKESSDVPIRSTDYRVREAGEGVDALELRQQRLDVRTPHEARSIPSGSRAAAMFREIIADLLAMEAEEDANLSMNPTEPSDTPIDIPALVAVDAAAERIAVVEELPSASPDLEDWTSAKSLTAFVDDHEVLRDLSRPKETATFQHSITASTLARGHELAATSPIAVQIRVPVAKVDERTPRRKSAPRQVEPDRRRRQSRAIGRRYVVGTVLAAVLVVLLPASRVGHIEPRVPTHRGDDVADQGPATATGSHQIAEPNPISSDGDAAENRPLTVSSPAGGYSIAGLALDHVTGAPIAGASIYAPRWNNSSANAYTKSARISQPHSRTNEAGEFLLSGLRTGAYGLIALHDEYVQVLPVVRHDLQTGPNSRSPQIHMVRGGNVEGRVQLLDRPFPLASLTLVRDDSVNFRSSATTNSEGQYAFENLPPGTYRLAATLTDQGLGFRESLRASVESGRVTTVDFGFAEPKGTILGRIQRYNPVLTYNIHAETLGGPIEWRESDVNIAEDGVFIMTGLPPGQYRVAVECRLPGRNRWHTDAAAFVRQGEVALADFCFAANSTVGGQIVNMELEESASVWATNRFRIASVNPGVVERIASEPGVYHAYVDRNGRFEFEKPLEAGTYMVVAAGMGERYAVASLHVPSESMRNVLPSDAATYMELELSDERKMPLQRRID